MRMLPLFALLMSCSITVVGAGDAGIVGDTGEVAVDASTSPADARELVDVAAPTPDTSDALDAGVDAAVAADAGSVADVLEPDAGSSPDAGADAPAVPRMAAAAVITRNRCVLDALMQWWCWDTTGAATYLGTATQVGGRCARRGTEIWCYEPTGLINIGALEGDVLERSTASTGCTATGEPGHVHCWGPSGTCTLGTIGSGWGLIFLGIPDLCAPSSFVGTGALGPSSPYHPGEQWIALGQANPVRGDLCVVYVRDIGGSIAGHCEIPSGGAWGYITRPAIPTDRMTSHVIEAHMWCAVVDGSDVICAHDNEILWDLPVTGAHLVGLVDHPWGTVPHVVDLETCVATADTISCYRLYRGVGQLSELLYTVH